MTEATLERQGERAAQHVRGAAAGYVPQVRTAARRAEERPAAAAPAKMAVRDLNLHYKDFHALNGINLEFPKYQGSGRCAPAPGSWVTPG